MKCSLCNARKAKKYCERIKANVCHLCCGSNRNLSECNYNCEHYPKEKTDRLVVGNPELMQNNNGKVMLFASNCFLPNIFDILMMDIIRFDIYILNYGTIRIKIDFIIKENTNKTKRNVNENEAFLKDDWKKEDNGIMEDIVPLIQIYTIKGGKTDAFANLYKIEDREISIKKISNYLNTFMPFGTNKMEKIKPKQIGMPTYINANICKGDYFQGKNDTYYCELKLNKEYHFDFRIEYEKLEIKDNIIAFPFGIFFPFDLINIRDFNIYSTEEIAFSNKSLIHLILPTKGVLENYNFIPLEGNENCFRGQRGVSIKLEEMTPPCHYDKYAIEMFDLGLESNKELMCRCFYQDLPLQIGNYESLNKIYENMYSPLKISVINNTEKIKYIEIYSVIDNLSEEIKQKIEVLPKEYKLIPICPNLNVNEKKQIKDITNRNMRTVIKENKNTLIDETHEIVIFPKNLFVFSMENKEKNWKVSLVPHIARFITPHESCIDNIYTIASRQIPLKGYLSNNREILLKEIKAIYDAISENLGLQYIADSYWFGTDDYKKQNIKLPKEVIETKCGNCLELSILLASCFEKLALDVFVVLIPGHAFIGVKLFENEKIYIESTMIGKRDFYEAVKKGQEQYDNNFVKDNPKVPNAQVVSIKDSRKIGIYPME